MGATGKITTTRRASTRLLLLAANLLLIGVIAAFGPPEKTLGTNVRVVYLHGAWVWTALIAFLAAALSGAAGLWGPRPAWLAWSRALGRTGLLFWVSYLPISMWAMQANWNGLYLIEPRWRMAIAFAAGGLILQIGVTLMEELPWAAAANILYFLALVIALLNTENVLHPPAPILNSDAWRIQLYFAALVGLTLLAAGQIVAWWRRAELYD